MIRLLALFAVLTTLFSGCTREEAPAPAEHGYQFSTDWFSHNIPLWRRILEPYRGKPDLRYLEIGVFEGRSVTWMIDNVLTHPSSELVAVDLFVIPDDLEARFRANLERSGFRGRATVIKGRSQVTLQQLPLEYFDIIYVDGSHALDDVLTDMTLSWELLAEEGIMILDDYRWKWDLADDLLPLGAVDAFVNAFWKKIEVLHKGYQYVVRKKPNLCDVTLDSWQCSPVGPYRYLWGPKTLLYGDDLEPRFELTEAEAELIETIINARGFAEPTLSVSDELLADEAFARLRDRLDLKMNGSKIVKYHRPPPAGDRKPVE